MISPDARQAACDKDLRGAMRRRAIAAREALTAPQYAKFNAALLGQLEPLMTQLAPLCLGFCWPYRGEADLRAWVADWLAAAPQRRAALPQVVAGQALRFVRWTPDAALREDAYGIPVPQHGETCQPDLLLIPLNAFDAQGFRIGYGGGYFDRTLAAAQPPIVAVGVGFELGRVASTLPQAHDRAMDWIVTEAGAFRCTRAPR